MGFIYRLQPSPGSPEIRANRRGGIFFWFPELQPSRSWETKARTYQNYIGEFRINTWWNCCDKVGYCSCNLACLTDFRIAHSKQGRGHGNQMMEDMIPFCSAIGFKSISLAVDADNKAAIYLYKKFGFETRIAKFHGDLLLMERGLS